MTVFTDGDRRVVPRWREFGATVGTGELKAAEGAPATSAHDEQLRKRVDEWQADRSVLTASELLSLAVVLNRRDVADEAAEYLARSPDTPELVRGSVVPLLNGHLDVGMVGLVDDWRKIAHLRAVLRQWPRNAVAWAQLALLYCRLDLNEKARRCLKVALDLAPTNRYVLRSAARFFVHMKDPAQAGHVLRKSERGQFDPWILAAEVSVGHIAGKLASLVRTGSRILAARKFGPGDTSELAASLGTVEIERGSRKLARRLFEMSALEPNDNVMAQLQWLQIRHGEEVSLDLTGVEGGYDHEARAFWFRRTKSWNAAIQSCGEWGADEAFSGRPFRLGSFIAIEALGDGARAVELANAGLGANRDDGVLLNNMAVGLAFEGRVGEDEIALRRAFSVSGGGQASQITLTATEGLVAYRKGEVCRGRSCYAKAIRKARQAGDMWAARRAFLYMCMEELAAGTRECKLLAESATRVGSPGMVPEHCCPTNFRVVRVPVVRFPGRAVRVGGVAGRQEVVVRRD